MQASRVLAWSVTLMWLGVAVWVYFDARKSGRSAWSNAVATFVLPGVGLAVYLGTRAAADRAGDPERSPNGERLVREMAKEVERLRRELAEARAALAARNQQ